MKPDSESILNAIENEPGLEEILIRVNGDITLEDVVDTMDQCFAKDRAFRIGWLARGIYEDIITTIKFRADCRYSSNVDI